MVNLSWQELNGEWYVKVEKNGRAELVEAINVLNKYANDSEVLMEFKKLIKDFNKTEEVQPHRMGR